MVVVEDDSDLHEGNANADNVVLVDAVVAAALPKVSDDPTSTDHGAPPPGDGYDSHEDNLMTMMMMMIMMEEQQQQNEDEVEWLAVNLVLDCQPRCCLHLLCRSYCCC